MHLSIIIPAFNESRKIAQDISAAAFYLEAAHGGEILVVDDGSVDDTAAVAEGCARRLSSRRVHIRVESYPTNKGKGYAVRHGVRRAKGKTVAFVDAGLCVPYDCFAAGLEKLESGFDYAIGSRRVTGANVSRPPALHRRLGSQAFARVVRLGLGISVSDTQCGFKLYRQEVARDIFSHVRTDGFMFDVEALVVAERLKYRGTEFPVTWANDSDTRYHPVWGTLRNLSELARIRFRHR